MYFWQTYSFQPYVLTLYPAELIIYINWECRKVFKEKKSNSLHSSANLVEIIDYRRVRVFGIIAKKKNCTNKRILWNSLTWTAFATAGVIVILGTFGARRTLAGADFPYWTNLLVILVPEGHVKNTNSSSHSALWEVLKGRKTYVRKAGKIKAYRKV